MRKLADQYNIAHEKDLLPSDHLFELCGYVSLACEMAGVRYFISPTGRVIYSPSGEEHQDTGENIHEIDIDWLNHHEVKNFESFKM